MTLPPPPPPPPSWGVGPGSSGGTQDHPNGTTILVLGILGLACCGLLGPIAWIMGNTAMREIDSSPGSYSNRGTVNAGRICGIVATAFLILTVLIYVIAIGAFAMTPGF